MSEPLPVWAEGLFLRPQHFQAADAAHSSAVHARIDGIASHAWGILELQIDDDLARGSQAGVRRLLCVLPDGEVIQIPGSNPPPPAFDVDAQIRSELLFLTLPARQEGAVAFAAPASNEASIARYHIVEREAVDATDPERRSETIEVGAPNIRFGVEPADLAGRTKIGIARVREVQGRQIIWDDTYIPPLLDIRASSTMSGFLIDILGRLEQRQDELSVRAVEGTQGGTETFAAFLLLQLLNRWQPEMRHLQTLERVHPERLFSAFVALAGELATFTRTDRRPETFPVYDHENLEACFRPVLEALRAGLSTEFSRSAQQLDLKRLQPGAYASTITDRSLYDQGRFYLAVSSRVPTEEIRRALPSVVKIGSVAKMQQLVQAALPGVPLTPVATPPSQIRVLPNFVYFELDRSAPDWRDFATAPALGLHIAGDWPDLQLELWCVKKDAR